mmetsp:Transcript_24885/g.73582  ORF Transcript_24885/g.73582 Transcript_24885/m.73582 type:complete len:105 (-) Transcript_24885:620-934(-)|eukprot:365362-Chlamydomonas_euryale.AAC.23
MNTPEVQAMTVQKLGETARATWQHASRMERALHGNKLTAWRSMSYRDMLEHVPTAHASHAAQSAWGSEHAHASAWSGPHQERPACRSARSMELAVHACTMPQHA